MTEVPERTPEGVWMHNSARTESMARVVAIDAMRALGMDPSDFRVRDKIIVAIGPRIDSAFDAVALSGR